MLQDATHGLFDRIPVGRCLKVGKYACRFGGHCFPWPEIRLLPFVLKEIGVCFLETDPLEACRERAVGCFELCAEQLVNLDAEVLGGRYKVAESLYIEVQVLMIEALQDFLF